MNYDTTLEDFREKILLHGIIIVHSNYGRFSIIDHNQLKDYLNIKDAQFHYFNLKLQLNDLESGVSSLKNICDDHLPAEGIEWDIDFDEISHVNETLIGIAADVSKKQEETYQIFLINNVEIWYYYDEHNSQLRRFINHVNNNKFCKLILLVNSENIHLLNELSDYYPNILDNLLHIRRHNKIFHEIKPDIEEYKKLSKKERKLLIDKLAVHKVVSTPPQSKEILFSLYKKDIVQLDWVDNERMYFELQSNSDITNVINEESSKPIRILIRTGALYAMIGILFIFGWVLYFAYQYATISEDINWIKQKEIINNVNKYAVESHPQEVLNSLMNFELEAESRSPTILQRVKNFFIGVKDTVALNDQYILRLFNAYPSAPTYVTVRINGIPAINVNKVDIRSDNVLIQQNEEVLLYSTNADSSFTLRNTPSFDNYKVAKSAPFILFKETDNIDSIDRLFRYNYFTHEILDTISDAKIYDFNISESGERFAYITEKDLVYYGKEEIVLRKSNMLMQTIKQDYRSAKINFLWNDQFIGINNVTEFRFYPILTLEREMSYSNYNDKLGDYPLSYNYFLNTGSDSVRQEDFSSSSLFFMNNLDDELVSIVSKRINQQRGSATTILKINTDPSKNIFPFKQEFTTSKQTNARDLDYENNFFFMGFNNEKITGYHYELDEKSRHFKVTRIIEYLGHNSAITGLYSFPREEILVSHSKDNEIILWNYNGIKLMSFQLSNNSKLDIIPDRSGDLSRLFLIENGLLYYIPILSQSKNLISDFQKPRKLYRKIFNNDSLYILTQDRRILLKTKNIAVIKDLLLVKDTLYLSIVNHGVLSILTNLSKLQDSTLAVVEMQVKRRGIYYYPKFIFYDGKTLEFRDLGKLQKQNIQLLDTLSSQVSQVIGLDINNTIWFLKSDLYDSISLPHFIPRKLLDIVSKNSIDISISDDNEPLVHIALVDKEEVYVYNANQQLLLYKKSFAENVQDVSLKYKENRLWLTVAFEQDNKNWRKFETPLYENKDSVKSKLSTMMMR